MFVLAVPPHTLITVALPARLWKGERGADDEGGSASASEETAAKKTATVSQACCRSVGGGIRLGLVESCIAFTDVDQERRRSKLDKAKNSSSPSTAKGNAVVLADVLPVCQRMRRSQVQDSHAINDVLAMNWGVMGINKMVQALQRREFNADQVLRVYWMI